MNTVQTKAPPNVIVPDTATGTSIGRKLLMAGTGIMLIGFVFGHMIGNLQIFLGQDKLNAYAQTLHDLGPLIWSVRLVMLVAIAIHIFFGIKLWWQNRKARPESYRLNATVQATLASRTMIYTGVGILLYVVYHLLHFTLVTTNPQFANLTDSLGRFDVYSMVVLGFQNWIVSGVYITAMAFLCFHLSHGFFSVFQTLGLIRPSIEAKLRGAVYLMALMLFLGYISMPIAVLLGVIQLPKGVI